MSRVELAENVSWTDCKTGLTTEVELVTRPTRKVGLDDNKDVRPQSGRHDALVRRAVL